MSASRLFTWTWPRARKINMTAEPGHLSRSWPANPYLQAGHEHTVHRSTSSAREWAGRGIFPKCGGGAISPPLLRLVPRLGQAKKQPGVQRRRFHSSRGLTLLAGQGRFTQLSRVSVLASSVWSIRVVRGSSWDCQHWHPALVRTGRPAPSAHTVSWQAACIMHP
ncbi:uncharacterized protein B0I36DRAFT_110381 [Microdochium trichocladiopsis]|uniref:Uncharacterized protein n=1 Tax=Microdochium trichocladiopsis TaxID=1682393 RepID=A0A9P9BVP8_9PEZI|nr:uncharacterized protein B0I36DRAFT_110381 [Microdochium trichocladiopsis]KAH7033552.1 hypothetical protein B0I36DRAFT_110381 [Microdochium trichocladiopsis]